MSVLKIKGDKIEVERPDGGKHTGQAAMLHFAFRQNAATIKNSWQSGWIITHDLMHSRKSESLVIKKKKSWVQASSVQVECVTSHAWVKYRLCTSEMPRALHFIYSTHAWQCVTAASPPFLLPNPVDSKKPETHGWMIHILYFHYRCFSHTVTYTFTDILRPGTAVLTETNALTEPFTQILSINQ